MTRALVLGATGHIGAHVVRALLHRGYAVRATYRRARYLWVLDALPVEKIQVDLEAASTLREILDGCELVVHCAGYYPGLTARRGHAVARGQAQIRSVFDVIVGSAVKRVVYVSSAATITPNGTQARTEAHAEPWPLTEWRPLYASVKIAMEREAKRYAQRGLDLVVVKPSVCIGEYDAHSFSGKLVLLFARGRLPVYLEYPFNVVYTGDVGVGTVLAAETAPPGEAYLFSHCPVTMQEWVQLVAREAGVSPPRCRVRYPVALAAASVTEWVGALTRTEPALPTAVVRMSRQSHRLDGSKAQRELGLRYTPVEEAVRRAVGWFREHGYLSGSTSKRS